MNRSNHYITQLKRTKIPDFHAVLDSEARVVKVAGRFEHRFACAATGIVDRGDDGPFGWRSWGAWEYAEDLWGALDCVATEKGELVLWAHNLPYDLRVTDGLRHLLRHGWTLENIAIARTTSWASWRKGKTKLMLCDSYSWLHVKLERYAAEAGFDIGPRDYQGAALATLQRWCATDCGVLAHAVCGILNYIADEDLGNLRPTGSGQSHAAWRKRWMPPKSVRVHDNMRALAAEREAMHTGRAEAWRLGEIKGPIHELDLNLAYCRIAAGNDLPVLLTAERASMSVGEFRRMLQDYAILADVTVTTTEPMVPTTRGERVLWPIGTFRTTLWDPEVLLLVANYQRVEFNYCWLYKRGNALREMSQWLVDQQHGTGQSLHPAARRMLKHWARTLVGRMALRYRQWEPFGEHPIEAICASYEPDPETGETHKHLRIGHTMLELAAMTETKSSCPMIPGWVQSQCRVIIWELMNWVGLKHVLYVDTDGMLVDGHRQTDVLPREINRPGARLVHKATYPWVKIHGVRNVELPHDHRLSGVPKSAVRTDEITWEGETWTGLEAALEAGHTDYVSVTPTAWTVEPEHHRREPLPGGGTRPYELGVEDEA